MEGTWISTGRLSVLLGRETADLALANKWYKERRDHGGKRGLHEVFYTEESESILHDRKHSREGKVGRRTNTTDEALEGFTALAQLGDVDWEGDDDIDAQVMKRPAAGPKAFTGGKSMSSQGDGKRLALMDSEDEPLMKQPAGNSSQATRKSKPAGSSAELVKETEEEQTKRLEAAVRAALSQVLLKKVALTQKQAQLKPYEGDIFCFVFHLIFITIIIVSIIITVVIIIVIIVSIIVIIVVIIHYYYVSVLFQTNRR